MSFSGGGTGDELKEIPHSATKRKDNLICDRLRVPCYLRVPVHSMKTTCEYKDEGVLFN